MASAASSSQDTADLRTLIEVSEPLNLSVAPEALLKTPTVETFHEIDGDPLFLQTDSSLASPIPVQRTPYANSDSGASDLRDIFVRQRRVVEPAAGDDKSGTQWSRSQTQYQVEEQPTFQETKLMSDRDARDAKYRDDDLHSASESDTPQETSPPPDESEALLPVTSSADDSEQLSDLHESEMDEVSDILAYGKHMGPLVASVSLGSDFGAVRAGQSPSARPARPPVSDYERQASASPLHSGLQSFQLGPHPVQAAENLMDLIPDVSRLELRKAAKPSKMKQVLLIGCTGQIGSMLLRSLTHVKTEQTVTVHCLIRANSLEAAQARLKSAAEAASTSPAMLNQIMARSRAWIGDVSRPRLGLSEVDYTKLATRVDGVFCAFAAPQEYGAAAASPTDENDTERPMSLFATAAETNMTGWIRVFELCSTVCHKHIFAINSLFLHPELLQPRMDTQREMLVTEADVETPSGLNRLGLSPHTNRLGCRAWCAGVMESVLKCAKTERGFSVMLARLPPFVFTDHVDACTAESPFRRSPTAGWRILWACVRTGFYPQLPAYLFALFCQPVDCALDELTALAFSNKRIHWVYHLLNDNIQKAFTTDALITFMKRFGIFMKPATWDDWCAKVRSVVTDCILLTLIDDLDPAVRRVLSADPAQTPADIKVAFSTAHRKHDLIVNFGRSPPVTWPPFRDFGKRTMLSMIHAEYFAANSHATLTQVDDIVKEAVAASGGLTDFGADFELAVEGWTRQMLHFQEIENSNVKFSGRSAIARTAIVYLMNMLYMKQRETQCPEILEQEIKAPVFIVGLNRAGTTFTHQLLACDKEMNRCPVLMELLFPYGEAGDYRPVGLKDNDTESWNKDPRRFATDDMVCLQTGGMSYKGFNAMHFRMATSYEEDLVIFEMLGRSFTVCAGFGAEDHYSWLMENDAEAVRKVYPFHKRFFQHLEYQRPGKRWVFKLPWHMLTVETLLETYPDAELIFLHRRPTPAITSWCGLELLLQQHYLLKSDPLRIGARSIEFMSKMVEKILGYQENMAMTFAENHPSLQPPQSFFLNVYFDDVVRSPIVAVQEVYAALGWEPMSLQAEREMWDLVEKSIKMRAVIKIMTCELSKVGLNKEEVKARFEKYSTVYFDPQQREKRQQEYKIARAIKCNALDRDEHFTSKGTLAIEETAAWQSALDTTRRSMQTVFSYARSRFTSGSLSTTTAD